MNEKGVGVIAQITGDLKASWLKHDCSCGFLFVLQIIKKVIIGVVYIHSNIYEFHVYKKLHGSSVGHHCYFTTKLMSSVPSWLSAWSLNGMWMCGFSQGTAVSYPNPNLHVLLVSIWGPVTAGSRPQVCSASAPDAGASHLEAWTVDQDKQAHTRNLTFAVSCSPLWFLGWSHKITFFFLI